MASEEDLESFARNIGGGQFGLAYHRPETWGIPTNCFGNVVKKVQTSGGRSIYGWMFQLKVPALGEYLVAINHAVWCSPKGKLFDVTPFHSDPINHPLMAADGSIYFLVDQKASPVQTERMLAPQPTKYSALGENPELVAYVEQLSANETEACRRIYEEHGQGNMTEAVEDLLAQQGLGFIEPEPWLVEGVDRVQKERELLSREFRPSDS